MTEEFKNGIKSEEKSFGDEMHHQMKIPTANHPHVTKTIRESFAQITPFFF